MEHRLDGPEDEAKVVSGRALVHVLEVVVDHALERGVAAPAGLPGAAAAGLHRQAALGAIAVLQGLLGKAGTGPDKAHVPDEHVDQLRQLVDGVLADEVAEARDDARVVLDLKERAVRLVLILQVLQHLVRVRDHAAELVHAE